LTAGQTGAAELPPDVIKYINERNDSGETDVLVARNGIVLGAIGIADVLRDEASQAVDEFKSWAAR